MRALTFMGDEKQAVFTLEFTYHDSKRRVINATVKRSESYDWFLVGLEEGKLVKTESGTGRQKTTNETWEKTGAIKSYKWDDVTDCVLLDVYEYEGA